MESKNVSDFLCEIARPFASCNLCKRPLPAREIARGNKWPRRPLSKLRPSRMVSRMWDWFVLNYKTSYINSHDNRKIDLRPFHFLSSFSIKMLIQIFRNAENYAWVIKMVGILNDVIKKFCN